MVGDRKIDLYKEVHRANPDYGSSSTKYLAEIRLVIDYVKPKVVLDYGCGKGALIAKLRALYPAITFYGYDPAIAERSVLPVTKADLVINTDVLEHIPESALPDVVREISTISQVAFFALHHALAQAILPDGQNAHCTVRPPIWYYQLISASFPNAYQLAGRAEELSAMITFAPTSQFLRRYAAIVDAARRRGRKVVLPCWLARTISLFIPSARNRRRFLDSHS